jgi:hypothetical protein
MPERGLPVPDREPINLSPSKEAHGSSLLPSLPPATLSLRPSHLPLCTSFAHSSLRQSRVSSTSNTSLSPLALTSLVLLPALSPPFLRRIEQPLPLSTRHVDHARFYL